MKIPNIIIVVFIFALFIRIYKLGTYPLGFHVDEAKVAWESLSILKTGRDDHGNLLALYYNSFGDYRPTGIFYTAIPFIFLFGRTVFAVRFSSALFGALTIFPLYFISLKITKNKKISLISSIFLAIIPWDITTSRATSEVIISCFLILTSLSLLQKKPILSFILLGTSFFFYHSARVAGTLLMLVWIIYSFQSIKIEIRKRMIMGFLIVSFFSLILILSPSGQARYNQVKLTTFNIRNIIVNYSSYFDPKFLIGDITKPFRYTTSGVGIVSIPIFLLFVSGIYVIFRKNKNKILLLFLIIGPIPASLTLEDSPNLHRAFFMLPFLVIIAAIGFNWLCDHYRFLSKLTIFIIVITFITFIKNYTNQTNNFAYEYRDPQIMEVADYIRSIQNNYSKIYVTNDPDSPYPWYAFFTNIDPAQLNTNLQKQIDGVWNFQNIIWDNNRCPKAKAFESAVNQKLDKILVVENGMCTIDLIKGHTEAKMIKKFEYNGNINYRVWEYSPVRK